MLYKRRADMLLMMNIYLENLWVETYANTFCLCEYFCRIGVSQSLSLCEHIESLPDRQKCGDPRDLDRK